MTLGFAQTPAAGSNPDPANVKGCLGGSDGNYTVAEDGTRQIFKITTSSVDLKPHLGHDVKLTGHKTSGTVSSGAADNSFAVTELSMISEHCAAAAAAKLELSSPIRRLSSNPLRPQQRRQLRLPVASTPAVDAAAPAATVRASSTASTPAVDPAAPAATSSPSHSAPAQWRSLLHPLMRLVRLRRTRAVEACCTQLQALARLRQLSPHPLRTLLSQRDRQPMLASLRQSRLPATQLLLL